MKPRLDAAYRQHNEQLQRKQEEQERKHPTYSSNKVQLEEDTYSSNKIQEEDPSFDKNQKGDNEKTLLEEEENWSVQKALSGVAGIGHYNEQQPST